MTEKAMMKTSALGYASGLRRLYYSCPAVSQRERLMRVLSTLIVVVVLSKIVGTYSVGNLFCEYLRVCLRYVVRMQVFPTTPSPTITNFMGVGSF
jgi:hypothetical protein